LGDLRARGGLACRCGRHELIKTPPRRDGLANPVRPLAPSGPCPPLAVAVLGSPTRCLRRASLLASAEELIRSETIVFACDLDSINNSLHFHLSNLLCFDLQLSDLLLQLRIAACHSCGSRFKRPPLYSNCHCYPTHALAVTRRTR